jgi:Fe-S oxidoreductase
LNTGAARIAVACPFCHIMLEAGMQKVAPESGVEIVDIVRLVEEANAE